VYKSYLGENFPIAPKKDLYIATVDVKEEYTLNFEMKQRKVFLIKFRDFQ